LQPLELSTLEADLILLLSAQAELMMRDFDDIMKVLEVNLTSSGCLDKDVRFRPVCTVISSFKQALERVCHPLPIDYQVIPTWYLCYYLVQSRPRSLYDWPINEDLSRAVPLSFSYCHLSHACYAAKHAVCRNAVSCGPAWTSAATMQDG
jgi:hypothetical protein